MIETRAQRRVIRRVRATVSPARSYRSPVLILTVMQGPDKGRKFELPDHEPKVAVKLFGSAYWNRASNLTMIPTTE